MTFTPTLGRPAAPASELTADAGLSRRMITLFSVAAGLAVANIYYAQPLLAAIADTFGVGSGTASLIVTLGQLGYTAGLGLIVPLGDSVNRRHLITSLLAITTVALAVSAAAPRFAVLALASGVLAVTAVVGPILVPFAATLAAPEQRGQVTGTVMSGVLFGVLLSRTVGGLLAQLAGWRTVFAAAAASTAVLAVTLYRVLPDLPHAPRLRYLSLLASVASLVRQEPTLRLRAAYGFFRLRRVLDPVDLGRVPAGAHVPLRRGRHRAVRPGRRRRRAGCPGYRPTHRPRAGRRRHRQHAGRDPPRLGADGLARRPHASAADRRHPHTRPRCPGQPRHQSRGRLPAAPGEPQPTHDRLLRLRIPRRPRRLVRVRTRVRPLRLDWRHPRRRRLHRGRAGHLRRHEPDLSALSPHRTDTPPSISEPSTERYGTSSIRDLFARLGTFDHLVDTAGEPLLLNRSLS